MTLPAAVPQSDIGALYTSIAPMYDLWSKLTESRSHEVALREASVRDGEAVLEVAVGTGLLFASVAKANPRGTNVGLDLSPGMLDRARQRFVREGLRAELRLGDAHRLDLHDESFDLVLNSYMFDLLPEEDFSSVLGEFYRVLKPGGRAVVVNMAPGEGTLERVYERLYRLSPRLMGGCRGVTLEGPMRAAGFRDVRTIRVVQLGFPSEVVTARKR